MKADRYLAPHYAFYVGEMKIAYDLVVNYYIPGNTVVS